MHPEVSCPRCHQNAPLVFQGLEAHCVACGAPRAPWSAGSVTYAGRPSRVGGLLARIFGWGALGVGLVVALFFGLLFGWIFPGTLAPWIVGGAIAALSMLVGVPLLMGGKRLDRTGEEAASGARMQGLFALAANRGGALRAHEASAALGVTAEEADALLTRLAKERPEDVTLDVSDQGEVVYGFPRLAPATHTQWSGPRFAFAGEGVRVAPPAGPVRVLDAEFEEIEDASPARRRARV